MKKLLVSLLFGLAILALFTYFQLGHSDWWGVMVIEFFGWLQWVVVFKMMYQIVEYKKRRKISPRYTPEQVDRFETLLKLRDFEDKSAPHLKEVYTAKFEAKMLEAGVSGRSLAWYEDFKREQAEILKAELQARTVEIRGVKFKSGEALRDYLKNLGAGGAFKFLAMGIADAFKKWYSNQFKK